MNYERIREAVFLERPNRFVAHVLLDGEIRKVHVKNTGRCKELLQEGVTVFLEDHTGKDNVRKTEYSLVAVEKKDQGLESGSRIVNMDSQAPNRVVGEALTGGTINLPGLVYPLILVKPESTFGASRFDFYVEDCAGNKAYLEVKGVTLETGGIVRFPDAPTERGVKHVYELGCAAEQGYLAYLIFVIQMKDVLRFEPNDETHPAFGEALQSVRDRGVVILAYDCDITADSMKLCSKVPVCLP
jgi:sugar fermentation stimulation protein A